MAGEALQARLGRVDNANSRGRNWLADGGRGGVEAEEEEEEEEDQWWNGKVENSISEAQSRREGVTWSHCAR